MDSFYERTGVAEYVATELTRGPWDPGAQHAGPPSALLGREIEAMEGSEAFQVGRIVFENPELNFVDPGASVVDDSNLNRFAEDLLKNRA